MVAVTGGFTRFENARQFCCFAGLAPFKYESGTSVRSKAKTSKRANQSIKALQPLAALGAATHMKTSEYRDRYERKISEGKHVLCVLNTVRAKLVHRIFAVIKRDSAYVKEYKRILEKCA